VHIIVVARRSPYLMVKQNPIAPSLMILSCGKELSATKMVLTMVRMNIPPVKFCTVTTVPIHTHLYSTSMLLYTVPKAMYEVIVNNEKKKDSSYGMKSFIL
jgi:hypothetical protein